MKTTIVLSKPVKMYRRMCRGAVFLRNEGVVLPAGTSVTFDPPRKMYHKEVNVDVVRIEHMEIEYFALCTDILKATPVPDSRPDMPLLTPEGREHVIKLLRKKQSGTTWGLCKHGFLDISEGGIPVTDKAALAILAGT